MSTVFQFHLKGPDASWVVDVKNGKGSVTAGTATADVTLELADADFLDMTTGKADPQKLYFAGKLKISGNVMASQKLDVFLKKVDPQAAMAAIEKARGGAAGGGACSRGGRACCGCPGGGAASMSAGRSPRSGDYVEKTADLVGKVGTVFQFDLGGAWTSWSPTSRTARDPVSPRAPRRRTWTELADADFDMTSGSADLQKLFMTAAKISGNIMASQKLMFLKKVDPQGAMAAIQKARSEQAPGAAPAAPAPSAKASRAPAIFEALAARLAKDPGIAAEVGAVIQFVVKDPDAAYTVDLASAPGAVREGKAAAATTLTLAEEDLVALVKGASAGSLHQHGKLRVDGDVRPAHKLGFLKDLV